MENLTVIFLFLRTVINIPTQTLKILPQLLFHKMIISQLELGQPVVRLTLRERWQRHEKRELQRLFIWAYSLPFCSLFCQMIWLDLLFSFYEEHCGHFGMKC